MLICSTRYSDRLDSEVRTNIVSAVDSKDPDFLSFLFDTLQADPGLMQRQRNSQKKMASAFNVF